MLAGRSAVTHCDGSGLTMPDLSTIPVQEIKLTGQQSHGGKDFVDLLTSDDAELRSKVAGPVAQAFEYAASATMIVAYLHALDSVHTCPSLLYIKYMCRSVFLLHGAMGCHCNLIDNTALQTACLLSPTGNVMPNYLYPVTRNGLDCRLRRVYNMAS